MKDAEFNIRYARSLAVDGFDERHQELLCRSKVIIVGCGALGSQVALYLAGAGVGTLGLVDYDNIALSNLHRQVAYRTSLVGASKARTLSRMIGDLNPGVSTEPHILFVRSADELLDLINIGKYDLVIDATDNANSKSIVTQGAKKAGVPCVVGGVDGWKGQVTTILPDNEAFVYEDIFGTPSKNCESPTRCSTIGVIGPIPGIISAVQATEAIKIITGSGAPLSNRLLLIDGLTMTFRVCPIM